MVGALDRAVQARTGKFGGKADMISPIGEMGCEQDAFATNCRDRRRCQGCARRMGC